MPLQAALCRPGAAATPQRSCCSDLGAIRPGLSPSRVVSSQNTFRACGGVLYLLGISELRVAKVQTWTQRVSGLVDSGEWLEAFGKCSRFLAIFASKFFM